MKLKHKYRILSNPAFVKKTVIAAAYSTMQLEEQGVSQDRLAALYEEQKAGTNSLKNAASSAEQSTPSKD